MLEVQLLDINGIPDDDRPIALNCNDPCGEAGDLGGKGGDLGSQRLHLLLQGSQLGGDAVVQQRPAAGQRVGGRQLGGACSARGAIGCLDIQEARLSGA